MRKHPEQVYIDRYYDYEIDKVARIDDTILPKEMLYFQLSEVAEKKHTLQVVIHTCEETQTWGLLMQRETSEQ